MHVRWKRLSLVAVAACCLAVVATSFASAAPTSGAFATATQLEVYGFGPGDEIANTRADLATAAVGGNVDNPRGGFNDQQFLASLASGDVPDVVYLDRAKVAEYAAKGAFQPLTQCVTGQKIDLKQYQASTLKEITYKGKLYGIPEFTNPRTVIVDNHVVADAGLKVSDLSTKNWGRLAFANRKMLQTSGGKVTRIGFDPKLPEFFPLWVKANGADILSKNGLKAQLNTKKAVAALTFAYSLIRAHGGWGPFKSFRDTWDFFGSKNQVEENQIGAWPMEQWYYNVLAGSSPKVHITALQFRNLKGQPINYETGSAWAIPKGAHNTAAACTWMKTMTSTSTWLAAAKNRAALRKASNQPYTGISTGNSVADQAIYKQTYTSINKYFDEAVKKVLDVQRFSFGIPASPASAEFKAAWNDAVTRVLAGQQTPKQALDQAQKEAQNAINAAK